MAMLETLNVNVMRFPNGQVIVSGAAQTRALACAAIDAEGGAIGSLYISSDRTYQKTAAGTCLKITASAAD